MSLPLIEVSRGEVVECIHRGDIAVVNSEGKLLFHSGDPYKLTYMRSAAKPIQALNAIISGAVERFSITPKELAVISSSHYAETFHLEAVESILNKIGLNHHHIFGGTVTSLNKEYSYKLAWDRIKLTPAFSDCSGKHAGMLAVCQHKDYPIKNYFDTKHPCQLEIKKILSNICIIDEDEIKIGVDGCSAPVHALPLYNMALGYSRFTNPVTLDKIYTTATAKIFDAMNKYPEMISGTGGFCTELIKHTNGKLIGKIGAEGVYCVGHKEAKLGFAMKIESGSMAVLPPVVISILKQLNLISKEESTQLEKFENMDNINDVKTVVGEIRPVFNLSKDL